MAGGELVITSTSRTVMNMPKRMVAVHTVAVTKSGF
jgi:hypothetical protein